MTDIVERLQQVFDTAPYYQPAKDAIEEIKSLRQQLAASKAREKMLREQLALVSHNLRYQPMGKSLRKAQAWAIDSFLEELK